MERYEINFQQTMGAPAIGYEAHPEGDWVKYVDHLLEVKKLKADNAKLREGISDCTHEFSGLDDILAREGHSIFSGARIKIRERRNDLGTLLEQTSQSPNNKE